MTPTPICKCGHRETQHFTIGKRLCILSTISYKQCECDGYEPVPKEHLSKPEEKGKK